MRHVQTQRALASLKYRLRTFKHQRCKGRTSCNSAERFGN